MSARRRTQKFSGFYSETLDAPRGGVGGSCWLRQLALREAKRRPDQRVPRDLTIAQTAPKRKRNAFYFIMDPDSFAVGS